MTFRRIWLPGPTCLLAAVVAGWPVTTLTGQPGLLHALVTSPAARTGYLAHAIIWQDPGELSAAQVLEGPAGVFPYTFREATVDAGIACAFAEPGQVLAGKSPKFTCVTADQRNLRLKYWDPDRETGNREAFATVAATRLLWALGFVAVPALSMNVVCEGCPQDPARGSGDRGQRRFVAAWQLIPPGPPIVSGPDTDQGWAWRDLDAAISGLPAGDERSRQRTHFAALTLLGVLLQHGDRKPEQQSLFCLAEVDRAAGEIRTAGNGDSRDMLFERPGTTACRRAAVAIVDAGATFGGAGRRSDPTTAKMHLESWRRKPVFAPGGSACRGALTVSLAAGSGSQANPVISEEGRQFLLERLHRLSPDHLRALFAAARVEKIHGDHSNAPAAAATGSVEAWVAALQDKIREIEARRCAPDQQMRD